MFTAVNFCLVSFLALQAFGAVVDFEKSGAVPYDETLDVAWANGGILNATLAALQPGDTFVISNKTFVVMGGIMSYNLDSVTIQLDGTLYFSDNMKVWPRSPDGRVFECLHFINATDVTFTSSGKGTLDGNGVEWWGIPGIGYLEIGENRPRLFHLEESKGILVENILFKNSPYWTFFANNVDGLEVRYSDVDARRLNPSLDSGHNLIDITAFNTDGFDVTGKNVWIHDCTVWNQDDCIAVKDGSENMLFERITASGLGLSIGSIGNSVNRNITFRDCHMKNTVKGIYMKFRAGTGGSVSDVLYENIVIDEPSQWGIWIGPAQQSDSDNLCAAHPCSLCWPILPGSQCNAPNSTYTNITLRNVTVNSPKQSPGIILANDFAPMNNVVFDNVVVTGPVKTSPFDGYLCKGVNGGVATGTTSPVPSCFLDKTIAGSSN